MDDLDGGVCRERKRSLKGGGRVDGGCRMWRRRVGCDQMSKDSLKKSKHVDGYIIRFCFRIYTVVCMRPRCLRGTRSWRISMMSSSHEALVSRIPSDYRRFEPFSKQVVRDGVNNDPVDLITGCRPRV